jgi:hypothetical protein
MNCIEFIYYDHYTFGEIFAHVNSWFMDNEIYHMEYAGEGSYRITGNFIDYDNNYAEYRVDNISWHLNKERTKMVLGEITEPEFIQIK